MIKVQLNIYKIENVHYLGNAIALRLPSCRPGFESQAYELGLSFHTFFNRRSCHKQI